jgi:hypothetical protein
MCKTVVWNDGVVPVESAHWKIKDKAVSKNVHTDLTGTADFSGFVKPRLAVGPGGEHNPEPPELQQFPNRTTLNRQRDDAFGALFVNASYRVPQSAARAAAANDEFRPAFAKEVRLAPKQVLEIEVPVPAASNFGVTLMADPKVSATLADDKGAVRGKNLAGSPESRGFFRTIFVEQGVTAGAWKLRVENTGTLEAVAVIAAWSDAVTRRK